MYLHRWERFILKRSKDRQIKQWIVQSLMKQSRVSHLLPMLFLTQVLVLPEMLFRVIFESSQWTSVDTSAWTWDTKRSITLVILLKSVALVFLVGLETLNIPEHKEHTQCRHHLRKQLWHQSICGYVRQSGTAVELHQPSEVTSAKKLTQPSYIPRQRWAERLEYSSHRL